MKKNQTTRIASSNSRKDVSNQTKFKNIFEAYHVGVTDGKDSSYSAEYKYAQHACCGLATPKIDGIWDQSQYQFLANPYEINKDCVRVHPALWNNGTNNVLSGIFKVLPGKIYQIRGYDMANITFVKTTNINSSRISANDHWLVMDTLMSKECTEAALSLFESYLGENYTLKGKIAGIIISHSHVDHYGGMETVCDYCIDPNNPKIIVPDGFVEHAVSENLYVGNAMGRRASYQYGSFIKPHYNQENPDPDRYLSGEISIGIGQGQSTGSISFVEPTLVITENQTIKLDELEIECQLTPGTEAPTEMNNYFTQYKALWLAENCSGTLHNLYTLRGAQVRDGKAWANYLMETVALYGDSVEVIFQSHNWPHWGNNLKTGESFPRTNLRDFLIETAAIYKYINDQTLLYMNMGYKMNEVSDMLTLPRAMQKNWSLKPFYGTPKHNSKAVYQRYLGWYDANPLHLEELPPELLAKEQLRYLQAVSTGKSLMEIIYTDITNGNYWIAAYMANQIILSNDSASDVSTAKLLCADALEQLGYQCESGTWRNAYLAAAYELRNGKGRVSANAGNMMSSMTTEMLLDYISILFDGELGAKLEFDGTLAVTTDKDMTEYFIFVVKNGAILYSKIDKTDVSVLNLSKLDLISVITGGYSPNKANIMSSIANCLVRLGKDRYKYFDIMCPHDSEVFLASGETVNLRDYVIDCIALLEPYLSTCSTTETIGFLEDDLSKWKQFYDVLKIQTGVILDGDFFNPENSEAGIGTDGEFYAYELYYVLYSLYRYLTNYYIKNDTGLKAEEYAKKTVLLKKIIAMLESYVPDFYLGDGGAQVTLDAEDWNAWGYALGIASKSGAIGVTDFFKELYEAHKELTEILKLNVKEIALNKF